MATETASCPTKTANWSTSFQLAVFVGHLTIILKKGRPTYNPRCRPICKPKCPHDHLLTGNSISGAPGTAPPRRLVKMTTNAVAAGGIGGAPNNPSSSSANSPHRMSQFHFPQQWSGLANSYQHHPMTLFPGGAEFRYEEINGATTEAPTATSNAGDSRGSDGNPLMPTADQMYLHFLQQQGEGIVFVYKRIIFAQNANCQKYSFAFD